MYGCVCDSSWEVGTGNYQVQETEYFGPDCSKRTSRSAKAPSHSHGSAGFPYGPNLLTCVYRPTVFPPSQPVTLVVVPRQATARQGTTS